MTQRTGKRGFYFNNLRIENTPPSRFLLVYNADGTMDAADYVVWRKTAGTQGGYELWLASVTWPWAVSVPLD